MGWRGGPKPYRCSSSRKTSVTMTLTPMDNAIMWEAVSTGKSGCHAERLAARNALVRKWKNTVTRWSTWAETLKARKSVWPFLRIWMSTRSRRFDRSKPANPSPASKPGAGIVAAAENALTGYRTWAIGQSRRLHPARWPSRFRTNNRKWRRDHLSQLGTHGNSRLMTWNTWMIPTAFSAAKRQSTRWFVKGSETTCQAYQYWINSTGLSKMSKLVLQIYEKRRISWRMLPTAFVEANRI